MLYGQKLLRIICREFWTLIKFFESSEVKKIPTEGDLYFFSYISSN